VDVDTNCWEKFFNREPDLAFMEKYRPSGLILDPTSESSMIELHERIQRGEGPYFLSAADIASKALTDLLPVYMPKSM
jgi:hypothetical protein